MIIVDFVRRAIAGPELQLDQQPAMARIQIISTAKPVKRASGSRPRRAQA